MRSFWAHAGRAIRILVIMLLLLGIGFLSLGLVSDQLGWWTNRPFLTNLVSGMTSACFGVPFALLILSSITARETSAVQRRNARNLLSSALDWLEEWVDRVSSGPSHDRVDAGLDPLTVSAVVTAGRLRSLISADSGEHPASAVRAGALACRDALVELRDYLGENFSYRVDMEEHWANTCAQWRFLDDHVKSRIYEQRLDWLRSDAAARFNTLLRDSGHPLLGVIPLRERTLPEVIDRLTAVSESADRRPGEATDLPGRLSALVVELETLRAQLPRMMRLREAMAIARGRPFQIDLTPGHGLQL